MNLPMATLSCSSVVASIETEECLSYRSSTSSSCSSSFFSRRRAEGGVLSSSLLQRKRRALSIVCTAKDEDGAEDASEDESKPGIWSEEGRKRMDEILQMRELIREAERLADERGELKQEDIKSSKVQEELAKRAKQQAEERKQAQMMFQLGQRAYAKGTYSKAVQFLEGALTNVPERSNLGGEIQIWLAMAYEANNRHNDCIEVYRRLERSHPNINIKRQAADLRYISEAPKLKIAREESVSLPILDSYYRSSQKTWSQLVRERKRVMNKKKPKKPSPEDWIVWNPPRWEKSPYFWVALTVWLTLAGISLMFQD